MTLHLPRTTLVLADVLEERRRQYAMHGTQSLGHGLRFSERREMASLLARCRAAQEPKARRWADVLLEEACEVVLATNALGRRAELVQLAAVCVQQIEAIDREGEGVRAGGYVARWPKTDGRAVHLPREWEGVMEPYLVVIAVALALMWLDDSLPPGAA